MQKIIFTDGSFSELETCFPQGAKCLVVGGGYYHGSQVERAMQGVDTVLWHGYSPNPKYEEVKDGIKTYQENNCNCILAVGGGSAIDTAKAIKLYSDRNIADDFLLEDPTQKAESVPFVAIPTTAGTGAESTRYSILYKNGEKVSLSEQAGLPDVAILWEGWLKDLPQRQKVATLLDALCHAIESAWSVKATDESLVFALDAIERIAKYEDAYLLQPYDKEVAKQIMFASNLAGRAIQFTSTTAPHALCYKLTTTYSIPHGVAVSLTLSHLWRKMLHETESNDVRGRDYNEEIFQKIAKAYGTSSVEEAIEKFEKNLVRYKVERVKSTEEELEMLVNAVAFDKLANHPAPLTREAIRSIYRLL